MEWGFIKDRTDILTFAVTLTPPPSPPPQPQPPQPTPPPTPTSPPPPQPPPPPPPPPPATPPPPPPPSKRGEDKKEEIIQAYKVTEYLKGCDQLRLKQGNRDNIKKEYEEIEYKGVG